MGPRGAHSLVLATSLPLHRMGSDRIKCTGSDIPENCEYPMDSRKSIFKYFQPSDYERISDSFMS